MGILDLFLKEEKPRRKRKVQKKMNEDELILISIRDLLSSYFYKEDLQNLCKKAGLSQTGVKDELIDRLMEDSDYEVEDYLYKLDMEHLKMVCEDINEYKTGNKPDLISRIQGHIEMDEYEEEDDEQEEWEEEKLPRKKKREKVLVNSSVNQVVKTIEDWEPEMRYPNESGYQSSLYHHIKESFDVRIRQEAGQSRADILIGENIAIEVKKNPNQSSYDRMLAQLIRQRKEFGFAIAVIFDVKNRDAFENFKELMTDYPDIYIVRK